jgi:hypothetical protein
MQRGDFHRAVRDHEGAASHDPAARSAAALNSCRTPRKKSARSRT